MRDGFRRLDGREILARIRAKAEERERERVGETYGTVRCRTCEDHPLGLVHVAVQARAEPGRPRTPEDPWYLMTRPCFSCDRGWRTHGLPGERCAVAASTHASCPYCGASPGGMVPESFPGEAAVPPYMRRLTLLEAALWGTGRPGDPLLELDPRRSSAAEAAPEGPPDRKTLSAGIDPDEIPF